VLTSSHSLRTYIDRWYMIILCARHTYRLLKIIISNHMCSIFFPLSSPPRNVCSHSSGCCCVRGGEKVYTYSKLYILYYIHLIIITAAAAAAVCILYKCNMLGIGEIIWLICNNNPRANANIECESLQRLPKLIFCFTVFYSET